MMHESNPLRIQNLSKEIGRTRPPSERSMVAIFYPFSQFCEINTSLLSMQTQPNTAPNLFQRGVDYGKYEVCGLARAPDFRQSHPRHILPPSEIDLGLCLAVFAGSGGKYLFHRIG